MVKSYEIDSNVEIPFHNNVSYCIGTGRMGLALHKEYQDQLKFVQDEIGFSHIRGHGLFCDDMVIYNEYENTNLVKIMSLILTGLLVMCLKNRGFLIHLSMVGLDL
ncbi:GH39 family glycosyl hydrolase [Natronospora cellulosivora (SeqCode)]